MGMIRVTAEDLDGMSNRVRNGSNSINEQLATLKSGVDGLVGGDWAGAASAQFSDMYNKWNQSAGQLNEALNGISQLLTAAAEAYRQTEEGIAKSMGNH